MKQLSLDDREFISSYLEKWPPIFSEFTFSNLMIWNKSRPTYFDIFDETLIFFIKSDRDEPILFGPPFGPLPLDQVIDQYPADAAGAIRTCLPEKPISGWSFTTSPDDSDYIYKVSDLIDYPGHIYHRKRQLMNGCLNRYDCEYELIDGKNLNECHDLQEKAFAMSKQTESLCQEHGAAQQLLQHFNEWDVFGGAVRINGNIEGFMIGERLSGNQAVGHVEKINTEIHGLSALLHHWFAKYSLKNYDTFNAEQDLGLPGLREAKNHFIPDHMVIKWQGKG